MIDQKVKIAIIQFVNKNGGKENCGMTWNQIAERFGLKPCKNIRKALSDAYRYYGKKQTVGYDYEAPDGFEVTALYGSPDNFQVALRKKQKNVDNAKDFSKAIASLCKFSPKVEKFNHPLDTRKIKIAYELPIQDFHFGREPIDIAVKKYKHFTYSLINRVSGLYQIEKFIFPVGNDLFNSDNGKYTTTKGTQQFDFNFWHETFEKGSKAVIEVITSMSRIAPVEVIMVPGNHDFEKNFYLGAVIEAWFRNDSNVAVDNKFAPFKFTQYGQCMIMYEHGELNPKDYFVIMPTERPTMFAETKFREIHTGHFHKEMLVDEMRGMKVRFIPSLATNSIWERFQGYSNLKTAQGFKWHRTQGLIGIEQIHDIQGAEQV